MAAAVRLTEIAVRLAEKDAPPGIALGWSFLSVF
jgi:hypothetical protein